MRNASRARLLALLVLGPLAALAASDFVIARSTPLWSWVAHEFPRRLDDDYLGEALLRTLPPGRDNVLLLGNSRADDSIDTAVLEQRFADKGLHFRNLTVAGSGMVDQAMRAREIAKRKPGIVIAMVDAVALRPEGWLEDTFAYDASAALEIFRPRDFLAEPGFHIAGLAGQLHVLARHRGSLQNSLLVGLGRQTFVGVRMELLQRAAAALDPDVGNNAFSGWMKSKTEDPYPNTSTRALEVLAQRMRDAGTRLVVVEAPNHPILIAPGVQPRVLRFREFVGDLAGRHGFEFVQATQLRELDIEHFRDLIHLNPDGRTLFTATLGDALDRLL